MTAPSLNLQQRQRMAIWLFFCCGLIVLMVVLGGVTRLTGSGLSIVEWKPVTGVIPPLNEAEWQAAFADYQQFPEFKLKNAHLDLAGFQAIYWLEYAHRLLGRLIGLAFIVPLLGFWWAGYFKQQRRMLVSLAVLFVLGGMQGLLGWYMVKSGLVANPAVSQYRLTAHLLLAIALLSYLFWVALNWLTPTPHPALYNPPHRLYPWALGVVGLVLLTLTAGGLVAGLKAGHIFNTFPLMDGHWFPPNGNALSPGWKNLFENPATAQFNHRLLALLTLTAILTLVWHGWHTTTPSTRWAFVLLGTMAILQVTLGILTLLFRVPVMLGAMHQGGAVILLLLSIWVTYRLKRHPADDAAQKF